jgi:small subunit ribosomal protein S1
MNVQNDPNDTVVSDQDLTTNNTSTEVTNEQEFSMEMVEQSMANVSSGQIVDGVVVGVDEKEVLVDIGCKSEAVIALHEFAPDSIPAKGDVIKVYVVTRESGDGKPILSKKRADFYSNYLKMKETFQNNETITGKLIRRVKGGMIADIMGVEAFLPGSQIALKNIPNLDQFINKEVTLKIIKLDEDRKNIIVSRRKVLESELESKKEKLKDNIKIDAELDGEVKNITEYGAFVDLGGIDGLLYITDMSWGRINHPAEMLNIGDKIKVKVIGFDDKNNRVSLGIKQLVPHPWENIEAKYVEGTKVSGKVVNITKYGAFVELEPGVEGLIHVSEMSWTKKISNPRQLLKVGDTISAIVLVVSRENQRISLGMKQMQPNPWLTIEERYPIGTILKRKIKNLTTFGVFVEIEPDIDGLIHISDISWTKRIYHPKEVLKKGQEIETVILSVDKLLHRVALGMKQLHNDPWEDIQEKMPVNTEALGRVSKCIPKGLLVEIAYEDSVVEGFIPISHLAVNQIDKTEDAFDIGEEIEMKIIEIDTENRRLILSIKAWFFSRENSLIKEFQKVRAEKIQNNKATKKTEDAPVKDYPVEDENYGYDDAKYKDDNRYDMEEETPHQSDIQVDGPIEVPPSE